ncbi:MAG: RNA polymerase sigma factor [Myxococcales bacterium]|nr:RNA polymerase sigma factor [Myxococcales bacterium]
MNASNLDAELVHRLVGGDLGALGEIYLRLGGDVRSFLARVEPDLSREDADDLCQETFLTFADGVSRYVEQGNLRAWLFGIAVRKARAHRRKRWWRSGLRRRHGEGAAGVSLHRPAPDDQVDARTRIHRLMEGLPAAQREVFVLTVFEGLSVQQAAEVLGIRENAASTRLYRARRALQEAGA